MKFFVMREHRDADGKGRKVAEEIDLPDGRFVITAPRYLADGTFVRADPEHPATIEIPEGSKIDEGLAPASAPRPEFQPHYATGPGGQPMRSAAAVFGAPSRPPAPPPPPPPAPNDGKKSK